MRALCFFLCSLTVTVALAGEPRREVGNLVIDGIPEIPAATSERLAQYVSTRKAAFVDWDLDGNGLLILTRFADATQVHHVAAPGADRQQLTFFRDPVSAAAYDAAQPGGFFMLMDRGGAEMYQLYWYDLAAGRAQLLTDGKSRTEGVRVANAGGRVAFTSTARDGSDFDVYVLAGRQPGSARLLKQLDGNWDVVAWSPDDSTLLLEHELSAEETHLHLLDVKTGAMTEVNPSKTPISYGAAAFSADGKSIYYSSDEDSEFKRLTRYQIAGGEKTVLTPKLDWDVVQVAVARDGEHLAYEANQDGRSAVYLLATRGGSPRRLDLPPGVVGSLRFDRQSKRLGLDLSSAQSSSDVYSVDAAGGKLTRWTFSEVGGLDREKFVAPALIHYPTFDGRSIPAWVYSPARAGGAGAKRPVVIYIHGGPESQSLASFSAMFQYWVNELGLVVIVPNVRGSSGYGKSYLRLDDGFLREDSVKDIGALLDWIATRPDLDARRVAVFGGSYGGYMVLAALTHYADRIRCGVDEVGISSFVTFLEHTSGYRRDQRRAEYGDERDPKMREFQNRISPLTNADKIKSPLFVAQGLNDPRVPASEAEQIVATVRKNGGAVWFMLAKDEGHGFAKRASSDYFYAATSLFFEQQLLK